MCRIDDKGRSVRPRSRTGGSSKTLELEIWRPPDRRSPGAGPPPGTTLDPALPPVGVDRAIVTARIVVAELDSAAGADLVRGAFSRPRLEVELIKATRWTGEHLCHPCPPSQ